jgi:hypothetical protein
MADRWDETWHRLREWTNGQAASERLAAQVLMTEGFTSLDPSHPLGGRDGGKDASCRRDGLTWIMAVYFPRGRQSFGAIEKKFAHDLRGAQAHGADGFAFVTNQDLTLSEREVLKGSVGQMAVELYHLERVTAVLDQPAHATTRKQFLALQGAANHPPTDKWVGAEYAERSGMANDLRVQGYRLCWVDANHESERIDLDGWEYAEVDQNDGSRARLKIRDLVLIGGYLVLLKKKDA